MHTNFEVGMDDDLYNGCHLSSMIVLKRRVFTFKLKCRSMAN